MSDEDDGAPENDLLPSEQPTVDAGSRKAVNKRLTKQRIREKEAEQFWNGVFQSEVGRREMWALLQLSGTFEPHPFVTGPNGFPNPEATWFEAGARSFGLKLYHRWLRPRHQAIALMHAENDPSFKRTDI